MPGSSELGQNAAIYQDMPQIAGSYQVCFGGLLEGKDGRALEAKIGLEVLGNLTYETLERELADEELRRLLVAADLAQCHGTGPVPVEKTKRVLKTRQITTRGINNLVCDSRFHSICLQKGCHRHEVVNMACFPLGRRDAGRAIQGVT